MTKLFKTTEPLKISNLGKENPLPRFLFQVEEGLRENALLFMSQEELDRFLDTINPGGRTSS